MVKLMAQVKEGIIRQAPRRTQKGQQLHRDASFYVELQQQDPEMFNNAENVGEITVPHHRSQTSNPRSAEGVKNAHGANS